DTALEDAAFSAVRSGHDGEAIVYFKRTIDAAGALRLRMSPQLLFDTRRAVATVSREVGVIASVSRSGNSAVSGPGDATTPGGLQTGVEAYWRPFGYQNGRTVEVFGRAFETLQDHNGGATGKATMQGTVGARWKVLSDQNIVLSFGRLIPIGSKSTSDWLAQAAYSSGKGTDLRVDVPSWWTAQWFGEAGRYFQHPQTYGTASAQVGRSFRLDAIDDRLVLFPYLTLNADYNSLNAVQRAVGAGPGVNLRYWFREDQYNAPRSSFDLSLQYRLKVQGDERARGFFMTTTLSY
ncbi:MAG: bacteriophage N4 adsorption protein A, partial [Burkholderiaceae bacterium]